ncbi:Ubiquinone biosynthesis monooxygenase UbiB [hydrothermal vent metagenome]|uniref:Ubiquinone biosynthesis monooxygenase UbiB n=1 Tax=hydrothermal vent metagenome TaxID=652676 RepID=A0A3B1C1X8_9ZZZZ
MSPLPIGAIRKAGRYLVRYKEIFSVLMRYGLADWAKRIELGFLRDVISSRSSKELMELSTEERICRAIMELGPTFIKFGQALSLRPDIVGVELSNELKNLQSNVMADPAEVIESLLEAELGGPLGEIFEKLELDPVASASIGQVHRGWLKSGEKVAVKVRRHGIEKIVSTDLEILKDIAKLLEDHVEESRFYRPVQTVDQFASSLTREMNFIRESRNIINLEEDLADDSSVQIPKVFEDLTTSSVLMMGWMDGVALNKLDKEALEKLDTSKMAEDIASLFLKMMFVNGFYHADPHPGNIMILKDGRLGLLDFGMVGRLPVRVRENMEDIVSAIISSDNERLIKVIIKAASLPHDLDENALTSEITDLIAFYGSMPLNKIKLFEALNEMVSIIHKHHMIMPVEAIMLIRTLVTLEGTNRALAPDFNLMSLVQSARAGMEASFFAQFRKMTKARRLYFEIQDFIETVPSALTDIIERFRKETLEIHMEHRGMERSADRLVLGILTASLFMGSSMVLSASVPPTVFGLSVFGILGYLVSIGMGSTLLWTMISRRRHD